MHINKVFLLAATLTASVAAQGVNCALLGTYNNHGPWNDVWGYTAPNGDEYALLGSTTGTVVIDVTNPSNPIETGWFPWSSSTWRDIRTYGNYAYVVTEATAGVRVINLSNPNNPTSAGTFGAGISNSAHNVCIDVSTGILYLPGSSAGTPAWDLTTSPTNPTYLGLAGGTGNGNYFHDLCVENGYGYGSMIYNGDLRIWNASTFPPTVLSDTGTPGNFTHNAWPNAAGTICVTTDETSGSVIKFFDITNKSNPQPLGQFTPNSSSIPHNAFIVGNKVHCSWYTEGYRCIDFSNPMNPVEVASYDTWPGSTGGYNGCWGCYPFFPSGNILASDRSTGLYIVRPSSAAFSNYGQGCPGSATASCPELNSSGGTISQDTRDNEYTHRVTNSGPLTVLGFECYAQSTGGTQTVAAYIYPEVGGSPSATALASTTMTIGAAANFYTATFASPVNVTGNFYIGYQTAAQNVYLCNLNSGTGGVAFYRDLVNGPVNWTQSGLVNTPSWRVNCTGGANGLTPSLGNIGLPILSSNYDVTLSDAIPASFAVMISGLSDTVYNGSPLPLPLLSAPGCSVYAAPAVLTTHTTSASGTASATFNIPGSPAYIGINLFHQWAVLDAVNPLGIVVSDAGKATIDN